MSLSEIRSSAHPLPGLDVAPEISDPEPNLPDPKVASDQLTSNLPSYDVSVVHRASHKGHAAVETSYGRFHQESVRYSDGAVRLVTIGEPKKPRTVYPVVSGDPWFTGPTGLNRFEIEQLVELGFPVVWSHHHGRHSVLPSSWERLGTVTGFLKSKSLAKSAAQDHALLDNLEPFAAFNSQAVIRKGYSRSAMAGEAFIAQTAALNRREIIWSHLEAGCFAREVHYPAFSALVARQLPHELKALGATASWLADNQRHIWAGESRIHAAEYEGTSDLHPLNLVHELAWLGLLMNGEAGRYARAVPLDSKGVRVIYEHDYTSQQNEWQRIHAQRPGIAIVQEPGAHMTGASPWMLEKKRRYFSRLVSFLDVHDQDYSHLSFEKVLDPVDLHNVANIFNRV